MTTVSAFDQPPGPRPGEPPKLVALREAAHAQFRSLGLPGRRDEAWRFTPLDLLAKQDLPARVASAGSVEVEQALARAADAVGPANRLVLVDGHAAETPHSRPHGPLARLSECLPDALGRIGQLGDTKTRAFDALSLAHFSEGAFVDVAAGQAPDAVLHVLHVLGRGSPSASHLRHLVRLGDGARATLVEHYTSASDQVGLTNVITEIELGRDAELTHLRIVDPGAGALHLGGVVAELASGARLQQTSLALGGALTRVEVRAVLAGEGAEVGLDGLYLGRDRQLVDHFTEVDHAMPRTTSAELYKGMLDDRSRGVFHGRVHVRPDAQQIDAQQTNRTLLLSDDARINTKPQLEIYADDVRCSHGASVGSLDPDALFYLRARGIDLARARALLTLGFAREVTDRLPLDHLRGVIEARVLDWLEGAR